MIGVSATTADTAAATRKEYAASERSMSSLEVLRRLTFELVPVEDWGNLSDVWSVL